MLYVNTDKLHFLSSASFHKTWLLFLDPGVKESPRLFLKQVSTHTGSDSYLQSVPTGSVWKAWGRTRRPGRQVGYTVRPIY